MHQNRADPSPTNAPSVDFIVTFSEDVTGVDLANFSLATTGSLTGTAITEIVSNTASTYTVTVATGTGDGGLRLDIPESATITDLADNPLVGLPYTDGEVYTVDRTAPMVISITRADPSPTNAHSVAFQVTFSEDVAGVDLADFVVTVTGTLTGTTVTDIVSTTGSVYTVTVTTGSGAGTLGFKSLP